MRGTIVPARLHWHRSQRIPRHFASITRSATLTPARRHTPVSRCQLARTERMTEELTVLAPFTVQLTVVAPPESLRPVSGRVHPRAACCTSHVVQGHRPVPDRTFAKKKKIAMSSAALQILARGLRISRTEAVWCFFVTDSLEVNLSEF